MKIRCSKCYLAVAVATLGLFAFAGAAVSAPKANHHNGQRLVGEKIKTNGNHVIDKKGAFTTSVETKDGKIAGLHVKHAKNGDVPVKKYKANKKMARAGQVRYQNAAFVLVQEYLGTTYIGYSYIDEYGNEEIYWFPYDMILDGDTGAVLYVPAN